MLSLLKSRKAWFFAKALLVAIWADDLAVACMSSRRTAKIVSES
jgi:hypothetical protein